ncbi:MAG TPA: hypothetical protein VME66_04905 [Candidatus Acidoferrales bacterium]|nr:hypothetical protein [Candidatus Acidoferrales bacterium]
MKRYFIALFLAAAPLLAGVAQAQVPVDTSSPGAGPLPVRVPNPPPSVPLPYASLGPTVIRGVQELNNSGEVGVVSLTPVGPNKTHVVIDLRSFPDHPQPAQIHRGHSCDAFDPQPALVLHDVVDRTLHTGRSDTIVNFPVSRLLSGNYVVDIRISDTDRTHDVACGELYLH